MQKELRVMTLNMRGNFKFKNRWSFKQMIRYITKSKFEWTYIEAEVRIIPKIYLYFYRTEKNRYGHYKRLTVTLSDYGAVEFWGGKNIEEIEGIYKELETELKKILPDLIEE